MLQTLLADRFKLRAHRETRPLPVYTLVVARADGTVGTGLVRSRLDCAQPSRERCGTTMDNGFLRARGATTDSVANSLSFLASRTVVDKTGLTDRFDVGFAVPILRSRVQGSNEFVDFQVLPGGGIDIFERAGRFESVDGRSTGIGDILARVKYAFWQEGDTSLAVGGELRLPTGNLENLRGTGETGLSLAYNRACYALRGEVLARVLRDQGFDPRGRRVLDVGCGTGALAGWIQRAGFEAERRFLLAARDLVELERRVGA